MTIRIVGINFDHFHMGDLLRQVHDHPGAEIAGICDADPTRMAGAIANFNIPPDRVFVDVNACLSATNADLAILCPATADHGTYVEMVAPHGIDILVEKPFAATISEARRMIAAQAATGRRLAINWPLAWYPSHVTAKRLVDEGAMGQLIEVHYYDGNRGPLYHRADKVEVTPEEVEARKPSSWFYKRAAGGGSLLDYLGYGTTLGSWFLNGEEPLEVTGVVDETPGLEVDQHSITVCRYARGLSKFETCWGTTTDPWTQQPQPKCGFVLVGTEGSISSYDYDAFVTLQTRKAPVPVEVPVDAPKPGHGGPVDYMVHCLTIGQPVTGPLSPDLCLLGQRIVDTAFESARQKRTLALLP
jgi:predicted dehydrogenase